jgi:DNA invertase Pin-like site-specific DNA recombinase
MKPKIPGGKWAVIYCRVSTKEQTENYSLATQQAACEEYCKRLGIAVDRVFLEAGESAKTADRTEFTKLIAYCRENARHLHFVVVHSLSRFSRNIGVYASFREILRKCGISLRSATEPVDDTSSGTLMGSILSVIAQYENDNKAERTVTGMRAAIEAGRWPFGVPLGYMRTSGRGSTIVPDSDRAPHVRRAFSMLSSGLHRKHEVLRILHAEGLRTLKGKRLTPQAFQLMARNPLYTGKMQVRSWPDLPPTVGQFEPLVSQETFQKVQDILDGRRPKLTAHNRNHPDFPLRCFVRCDACGIPITGSWSRGRSQRYAYYRCRNGKCRAVSVSRDELERDFTEYLSGMRPKPEYSALCRAIVLDVWREHDREQLASQQRAQARVVGLLV